MNWSHIRDLTAAERAELNRAAVRATALVQQMLNDLPWRRNGCLPMRVYKRVLDVPRIRLCSVKRGMTGPRQGV